MNIKIAVAHHKQGFFFMNDVFIPVQVGAALSNKKLDIQGDDTGDNISTLNPYYCELTALYWLWKNEINADYLGLCHYRRYFTFKRVNLFGRLVHDALFYSFKTASPFKSDLNYTVTYQFAINIHCAETELESFCTQLKHELNNRPDQSYCTNEIRLSGKSVYNHLAFVIGAQQIEKLKGIIKTNHADYYGVLKKCLSGNYYSAANMVIFERDIFNDYCKFLFSVLEEHRGYYAPAQTINNAYLRSLGYIAEILTYIFIMKLAERGRYIKRINTLLVEEEHHNSVASCVLKKCGYFHPSFYKTGI